MVVRMSTKDFVLVDTPWDNIGTAALVTWLRERYGDISITAINTHFHWDNLGGNAFLLSQQIPVYGSDLTVELLKTKNDDVLRRTLRHLSEPEHKKYREAYENNEWKPPDHVFPLHDGLMLTIAGNKVEIFHPGPAHTPDNIVVFFPKRRILFGGCMVRSLAATQIGTQSDSDYGKWPASAETLLKKYPAAEIVIPGHGNWGGLDLVRHTIKLLNNR
jgi:glyoxylase-like metal-dependent hydrolase (beta-lactamase superfamily II)